MNKAQQIKQLLPTGMGVEKIAQQVQTSVNYVNNIKRNLKNNSIIVANRRYYQNNKVKIRTKYRKYRDINHGMRSKKYRKTSLRGIEIRYQNRRNYYKLGRAHIAEKTFRHWTDAEEATLIFSDPNTLDLDLAKQLDRTVGAIQMRRSILLNKKLTEASKLLVVLI